MKMTIRNLMTVDRRSHRSGIDKDAGSVPGVEGEILVGSVILSEFARCELVTAAPQQDLDDVQRLQAQYMRLRPVVGANGGLTVSVVQKVIALHASGERRRDAVEGISR